MRAASSGSDVLVDPGLGRLGVVLDPEPRRHDRRRLAQRLVGEAAAPARAPPRGSRGRSLARRSRSRARSSAGCSLFAVSRRTPRLGVAPQPVAKALPDAVVCGRRRRAATRARPARLGIVHGPSACRSGAGSPWALFASMICGVAHFGDDGRAALRAGRTRSRRVPPSSRGTRDPRSTSAHAIAPSAPSVTTRRRARISPKRCWSDMLELLTRLDQTGLARLVPARDRRRRARARAARRSAACPRALPSAACGSLCAQPRNTAAITPRSVARQSRRGPRECGLAGRSAAHQIANSDDLGIAAVERGAFEGLEQCRNRVGTAARAAGRSGRRCARSGSSCARISCGAPTRLVGGDGRRGSGSPGPPRGPHPERSRIANGQRPEQRKRARSSVWTWRAILRGRAGRRQHLEPIGNRFPRTENRFPLRRSAPGDLRKPRNRSDVSILEIGARVLARGHAFFRVAI